VQSAVVLIPCLNEEAAIGQVVREFRRLLPECRVLVFDNNSTDRTADIARLAGAEVIQSPLRGKGNVIRHMLECVHADHYLIVDGDGTYPTDSARTLIEIAASGSVGMVVAARSFRHSRSAFRPFHILGNRIFSILLCWRTGYKLGDPLSGYRVLSRSFVSKAHLQTTGFEIEAEMLIAASQQGAKVVEYPVLYHSRPAGGESKLRTVRDGLRILRLLLRISPPTASETAASRRMDSCLDLGRRDARG
jgi:glycosyltransferase involved in cell wall biosynthesis